MIEAIMFGLFLLILALASYIMRLNDRVKSLEHNNDALKKEVKNLFARLQLLNANMQDHVEAFAKEFKSLGR